MIFLFSLFFYFFSILFLSSKVTKYCISIDRQNYHIQVWIGKLILIFHYWPFTKLYISVVYFRVVYLNNVFKDM